MKKLVFVGLGLALVLGAGLGVWTFFDNKPAEAAGEQTVAQMTPGIFVKLRPLILPVMGRDQVDQMLVLIVALEVPSMEAAARVDSVQPRLTDAFISVLYGALDNGSVMEGTLVDVSRIKTKLADASERVLGPGIVKNVLIQTVNQRPVS